MQAKKISFCLLCLILCLGWLSAASAAPVWAQEAGASLRSVDADDPMSWIGGLSSAAKNGEWSLVAGFCLLFLTTIADKLIGRFSGRKIPRKYMPWLAIGLGVLTQAGIFLAMGHHWAYALTGGLVAGLVASGGYSAIRRPVGAAASAAASVASSAVASSKARGAAKAEKARARKVQAQARADAAELVEVDENLK